MAAAGTDAGFAGAGEEFDGVEGVDGVGAARLLELEDGSMVDAGAWVNFISWL